MIDSTPSVLENPLTLPCLALEKKKQFGNLSHETGNFTNSPLVLAKKCKIKTDFFHACI